MQIAILRHAYFPDDPRDRKQALALRDAGHAVDVICLRKAGQRTHETVNGVRVFRLPLRHKRLGIFRYVVEYAASFVMMSLVGCALFLRQRYDCIQVSTMPDFLAFATVLPKLLGAKIVLDVHEPTPELWVTKYGDRFPLFLSYQERIEQLAIRYADWAFTVTEALKRRLGERGANLGHITVISNVCEETFEQDFHHVTHSQRDKHGSELHLVTHGLIEERYGHEVVIKAVNSLRHVMPELHYDIIGDGEYRKHLAALVQELQCEDRIHIFGFLSYDKLLKKLQQTDIGIIAMQSSPYSRLVDTNKMYEYIAIRKPVILSRLPAVEDHFDDLCVMFFEPGNDKDLARCIVELYKKSSKREYLVENAYHRYEKMRWSETKKLYVESIEDVVGEVGQRER